MINRRADTKHFPFSHSDWNDLSAPVYFETEHFIRFVASLRGVSVADVTVHMTPSDFDLFVNHVDLVERLTYTQTSYGQVTVSPSKLFGAKFVIDTNASGSYATA